MINFPSKNEILIVVLLAILGIWKLIEIIYFLITHIKITF
jgi:hypothetical protein